MIIIAPCHGHRLWRSLFCTCFFQALFIGSSSLRENINTLKDSGPRARNSFFFLQLTTGVVRHQRSDHVLYIERSLPVIHLHETSLSFPLQSLNVWLLHLLLFGEPERREIRIGNAIGKYWYYGSTVLEM
jgi:hypothetical protein